MWRSPTGRNSEDVVAKLGAKAAQDSVRVFMVPGVGHCAPGENQEGTWQHRFRCELLMPGVEIENASGSIVA
jgi:hypothetical protein